MTMNKFAIITGASRGIGKSCAELFQHNNWTVINISRHASRQAHIINISIDLSNRDWPYEDTQKLQQCVSQADKITLIHNAAENHKDNLSNLTEQDFRRILETNVIAPQKLNHLFLPYMKPTSSIIYIGSTLSEIAVKNAFSYVTTKHAVAGMMKATCQDLAGTRIHTACICPGFTDTEMLHVQHTDQAMKSIINKISFKRLIRPEEIAEFIVFCADHPVVNGAVLHSNLGQVND